MIKKPEVSEYGAYYEAYIALTNEDSLLTQLESQRKLTETLIEGLSEAQLNYTYATGKWSVKELFQHIIDTEIVFSYRALAIARGDRSSLPGYNQDEYAVSASINELSVSELLEMYTSTRQFTICLFNYIKGCDLQSTGTASGQKLSARAAGFIVLGHEKHHLNVLKQLYFNQ